MSNELRKLAAVAEYMGIAICEREGDVPSVWKGIPYHTDGKVYLVSWESADRDILQLMGLPDERTAKEFIEALRAGTVRGMEGNSVEAEDFLSFEEMLRACGTAEKDIALLLQRTWWWDDLQGVFVAEAMPLARDGQHRHS